ncbi:amidase [Rhizohabitans arisaemae]|uniref:amidase n=1 Tax=Rhizohabitans arisaemae TaxID=2720610 RepID=UPI0024B22A39|nr:amidase [Rhizohabitans arisaemae]
MNPLISLTVAEAAHLIRLGELSPVELTEAYLARIDEVEHIVQAFVHIAADQARVQARQAAAEVARGEWRGPLHGVPVGVKDVVDTVDMPTRHGSKAFHDHRPRRDATVVVRLREAGAVLIGKNTTQECAVGIACAPTTNPWDPGRIAGGSSGGSAAAVAARECAASIGSDTGGSIRIPAAFCGTVGLRPTGGVVSRRGLLPAATSLDRVGPITASVEDARILLAAIAGYDAADAASAPMASVSGSRTPLRGARIGVFREWADQSEPEIRRAFDTAVEVVRENGAELVEVAVPAADLVLPAYQGVALHELGTVHRTTVETRSHLYSPGVLAIVQAGMEVDADTYAAAKTMHEEIRRAWRRLFADSRLSACIAPAVPVTACPPGEVADIEMRVGGFTIPVSLADLPVVVQPMGRSGGLPVGLQWIGPPLEESRLLDFAGTYERSTDWLAVHAPVSAGSPGGLS